MERWMIVYLLPLEVWMDIFCFPWITREEFGQLVAMIGNFKFAEHAQFYLHEWGKHKLNHLCFDQVGMYTYKYYMPNRVNLDFPLTPMPQKIISFQRITIKHFEAQTIDFLHQIQPVLLNVNFELRGIPTNKLENTRVILAKMVPLLNRGIHSLRCADCALPMVKQLFVGEKLAKLKVLEIYGRVTTGETDEAKQQTTIKFLMDWLTLPRENRIDYGPKFCVVQFSSGYYANIMVAICEDFHAAKTTSTFAIVFCHVAGHFAEFHLDNDIGEELHGAQIGHGHFRITRHRPGCNKEMQEWIEANIGISKSDGQIWIVNPTIGLPDAIVDAPENEGENPQPSTSN